MLLLPTVLFVPLLILLVLLFRAPPVGDFSRSLKTTTIQNSAQARRANASEISQLSRRRAHMRIVLLLPIVLFVPLLILLVLLFRASPVGDFPRSLKTTAIQNSAQARRANASEISQLPRRRAHMAVQDHRTIRHVR